MEHHSNILGDHSNENWIYRLSSYPKIQNEWITDFLRTITILNRQIEALKTLLATEKDAFESIEKDYEQIFLDSIGDLERGQKETKKQFNSG